LRHAPRTHFYPVDPPIRLIKMSSNIASSYRYVMYINYKQKPLISYIKHPYFQKEISYLGTYLITVYGIP